MSGEKTGTEDQGTCIVHVPESKFEADIIVKVLEQEGVPCGCRRHEETAYDGIFVPQRGWGAILVPIRFRDKASEIIRDFQRIYQVEKGE